MNLDSDQNLTAPIEQGKVYLNLKAFKYSLDLKTKMALYEKANRYKIQFSYLL